MTDIKAAQFISIQKLSDILLSVKTFIIGILLQKETWLVIFGMSVLIFTCNKWIRHKKDREWLLTYKLKQELKKAYKGKNSSPITAYFEQIYLPSWWAALFVTIVFVAIFIIARIDKFAIIFEPLRADSNQYQNLIAIHAGIGVIIFALLIFVAESLRDDETKDRARVLLKESFLFPLTLAELAGFFIFIWGDVNVWAILAPLIVALLTITSLWRLSLVLLSRSRFAHKRLQLMKDRINKSIDLAISERFGVSILLQNLGEDKIELAYNPWSIDAEDKINRHIFYADKVGTITDIRLNKLDEFAKLVECEANKNGYSFYKEKVKPEFASASSDVSMSQAISTKFKQADRQFLHKLFKSEIGDENRTLISIEKRMVKDAKKLEQLTSLVKDAFIIKKQDRFSEEIKLEIDGLKDQCIAAIEAKKLGKIDELIKTYISISETFLESLNAYGGGYSYEQARKERGEIIGGWNEIRWLSDSIREFYIKAVQSRDQSIIDAIVYMPMSIAIMAIKYGDQYVFQELFLTFPGFLYWLALKETDSDIRTRMIDTAWGHLRKISDYYVEYQLKHEASDADSIKKYKDFTIPIFIAFQNLIKKSFDKSDFESFQVFLHQFSELYRDFNPAEDHPNAEYLRESLQWEKDPSEQETIRRNIEVQEEKERAAKDIHLRKRQVIFGLSSWIFEKYRNKTDNETLLSFYTNIADRLPNTLPELTELYLSSRQFETEHFWDWSSWEVIPDGRVHTIDLHSKLDRLYCVKALLTLQNITEESINSLTLPHSRDLASQTEGGLMNLLDAIVSDATQWTFALPQAAIDKIPSFKMLLMKAKDAQEMSEKEYIKNEKIDPDKLEKFKAKIKHSFYQSGHLRPVLKQFGAYRDLMSETLVDKETPSWGYNQIDGKEAFIKDWHVHYVGWGENYGRGMANGEDHQIFRQMVKSAGNKKDVAKQDLISEIETALDANKYENPVILQTLDRLYEYEHVRKSVSFVDRYRKECPRTKLDGLPGYMGVLKLAGKDVPIVDIFLRTDGLNNKVIITDLSKFCILNQFSPIEALEEKEYRDDIFFIRITDLNENNEQRQKIISENPLWLREYTDKEGHLREKVLINIYQRFEFKIIDSKMAFCIIVMNLPAMVSEN